MQSTHGVADGLAHGPVRSRAARLLAGAVCALLFAGASACSSSKTEDQRAKPKPTEGTDNNASTNHGPPRAGSDEDARAQTPQALTPQEIAKQILPSVMLITVNDKNGQPLAQGSCFAVEAGVVVTNFHVIDGATSAVVLAADSDTPLRVEGVIASNRDHDLAVLRVEGMSSTALPVQDEGQAEIGDSIYAVGNPRGLQGTFSAGIVSAKRQEGGTSVLQITAPISPGSSGGPVVNAKGQVIGIATATLVDGQNLNFAVGASELLALLKDRTAPRAFPKAKKKNKDTEKPLSAALTFSSFLWDHQYEFEDGGYSVSIRNSLGRPVKEVTALVIFYDEKHLPIDTGILSFPGVIPSGLARLARGAVDGTLKVRVSASTEYGTAYAKKPKPGRVEFRALDFNFAD